MPAICCSAPLRAAAPALALALLLAACGGNNKACLNQGLQPDTEAYDACVERERAAGQARIQRNRYFPQR